MKREIMLFIESVTKEYMNEPKRNWVISKPCFDDELNLMGFQCCLELEKGGIQIGDLVCLYNDSCPGSERCIIGTVLDETPFHFVIQVKNQEVIQVRNLEGLNQAAGREREG